jgi:excisionase family DNA binding protein
MTTRARRPSGGDTETGRLERQGRDGRRHRSRIGVPRYHTIKAVAEAIEVSSRTVRRWIENDDLVATRIHGVVRVADDDLRAFLALHRDA